jgi:hypothetical protein
MGDSTGLVASPHAATGAIARRLTMNQHAGRKSAAGGLSNRNATLKNGTSSSSTIRSQKANNKQ